MVPKLLLKSNYGTIKHTFKSGSANNVNLLENTLGRRKGFLCLLPTELYERGPHLLWKKNFKGVDKNFKLHLGIGRAGSTMGLDYEEKWN